MMPPKADHPLLISYRSLKPFQAQVECKPHHFIFLTLSLSTAVTMSSSNLPLTLVTTTRFLVGFSTLVAPLSASPFFGVPLSRENAFLGRLFGCRDMLLSLICLYDQRGVSP